MINNSWYIDVENVVSFYSYKVVFRSRKVLVVSLIVISKH